jgi:hypothetical protein
VVGLDTDTGTIVFVGDDPTKLLSSQQLSQLPNREEKFEKLHALYPWLLRDGSFTDALIRTIKGNEHFREHNVFTDMELDHNESVLAVGDGAVGYGFDLNSVLGVGPYSEDMAVHIKIVGDILLDNYRKGRVHDKQGVTLLASALYASSDNSALRVHAGFTRSSQLQCDGCNYFRN